MNCIEKGDLIIVHCLNPKEKIWGLLLRLDSIGPVIRGLDLASIDDWIRQERDQDEQFIVPSTVLIPMQRVEKIYLDESTGLSQSFGDLYAEKCKRSAQDGLRSSSNQRG